MVATVGKGIDPGYYLRCSEYYLGGSEPPGVWLSGPETLGVAVGRTVEADVFERLHAGLSPDGRVLVRGRQDKRVANFDLTCSAPKSVSIIYALADEAERRAIEGAQARAVSAVTDLLGREAGFIRRGRGGTIVLPAALSIAAFQHAEARPAVHVDGRRFADMDLHTHLCIANLGQAVVTDPTGARATLHGAIDARAIFAMKMACGALYHAILATGLQELGYAVAVTARNGIFELAGQDGPAIPEAAQRYFSARRRQIEARMAEYAVASADAPALAAAVTRGSRADKLVETGDRFARWRDLAADQGLDPDSLAPGLRFARIPDPVERDRAIQERLAALPEELTRTQSVIEHRQLVATVAAALVGTGADADRIAREIDGLATGGRLCVLGRDRYDRALYSTPELVAIERELQSIGRELATRRWRAVPARALARSAREVGLSPEQTAAAEHASGPRALALIEGAAGSGKTTTLKVITAEYARLGKRVVATATAWRTANMLRDELGVEARALDSLLAKERSGRPILDWDTVLLVDEAGQIDSRAMHALLGAAQRSGAKVLLVGDRGQLQAIAAGPALRILAEVASPAPVRTIVRQREAWARLAVTALSQGRASEALPLFAERDLILRRDGARATLTAAVDAWMTAKEGAPKATHLLIAKSNRTVRALNGEIRRRLRAAGVLTGPDHVVEAADASGRSYRLTLAQGERIRFGVRHDGIGPGVINGTTGIVDDIAMEGDGHLALTMRIGGRQVRFSTRELADAEGRVRLAHDLAISAYASQGLTAESATVVLDAGFDRHDAYVALSRSRGATRIVIDIGLLDAQVRAGRALTEVAGPIGEDERLAYLAARLSRAPIKTSTLDVAAGLVAEHGPRLEL